MGIQLSLFPQLGYGLLAMNVGELLFDHGEGRPAFFRTRRRATNAMKRLPEWIRVYAEVRPIEVHGADEEVPTYVIGGAS